jgi:hypothetical protein
MKNILMFSMVVVSAIVLGFWFAAAIYFSVIKELVLRTKLCYNN